MSSGLYGERLSGGTLRTQESTAEILFQRQVCNIQSLVAVNTAGVHYYLIVLWQRLLTIHTVRDHFRPFLLNKFYGGCLVRKILVASCQLFLLRQIKIYQGRINTFFQGGGNAKSKYIKGGLMHFFQGCGNAIFKPRESADFQSVSGP